jgi:hypothetical protein
MICRVIYLGSLYRNLTRVGEEQMPAIPAAGGDARQGRAFAQQVFRKGIDLCRIFARTAVPMRHAHLQTEGTRCRRQAVDCNFSADSRWLIYADKLDQEKPHQLFAVSVDI